MAIEGKIRTLYTDKTMSEALLPRTNTKAITDDKGVNLNAILDQVAYVDTKNSEAAVAPLNADALGGIPASQIFLMILPQFGSDDESKILQIVNGVPTWVSLLSAEEGEF